MERAVVALALLAAAGAVAALLRSRIAAPPTQPRRWAVPAQLDRRDFASPETPWLVVVFTSSTCDSCERVVPKAAVLASDEVAVAEVPYETMQPLHRRYGIDVVPTLVVVDADGVVHVSFVGVPTATDLWAAVAEARQPGSSPEPRLGVPD